MFLGRWIRRKGLGLEEVNQKASSQFVQHGSILENSLQKKELNVSFFCEFKSPHHSVIPVPALFLLLPLPLPTPPAPPAHPCQRRPRHQLGKEEGQGAKEQDVVLLLAAVAALLLRGGC